MFPGEVTKNATDEHARDVEFFKNFEKTVNRLVKSQASVGKATTDAEKEKTAKKFNKV
jgi:hypothetical protein